MKTYAIAAAAATLMLTLPVCADDAPRSRTHESTTIHKDESMKMHRSEQGERNANDPSSPHRALGRERAEQRHEMNEHRERRGAGATRGEEEHRTLRREERRFGDDDRDVKRRTEVERHEKRER